MEPRPTMTWKKDTSAVAPGAGDRGAGNPEAERLRRDAIPNHGQCGCGCSTRSTTTRAPRTDFTTTEDTFRQVGAFSKPYGVAQTYLALPVLNIRADHAVSANRQHTTLVQWAIRLAVIDVAVDEISSEATKGRGDYEGGNLCCDGQLVGSACGGRQRSPERDPNKVASRHMEFRKSYPCRQDRPTPPSHHRSPYRGGCAALFASSAIPAMLLTRLLNSMGIRTSRAFDDCPIWVMASTYFWAMK